MTVNNLCSSCTNIGCEFQSGIVRTKCAFYIPPHIDSDCCGNYIVMQSKRVNNIMELPKDEVVYGYISKQFPTTNVFFDSYETALNSAMHDQPMHRPFYMIKATRHFEFCGIVEKDEVKEDKT